ncbi:hypothetical protein LV84_00415 [Algoriphagus ratkowskyi]|uniref:Uncharacterized protein n=1 Tax=Algoriphagus ratkowskyi TaxID=57028 RepID=A0A2W7RME0_9BACT|nr:hypothetical protein [Algoriphagus ratkowskyi]PZX60146.1 hypothetical protein LV84_00415 [Algoriphagus ratkowskyi]TXD77973.1 hypothetical protein ESW18_07945 [Algoriphagus ratkowskyi]
MTKLKLIVCGLFLSGIVGLGISYVGSSDADAQQMMNCDWDGSYCKKPIDKAPCGCEDPQVD